MSGLEVVRLEAGEDTVRYAFGGADPVLRVRPGTVLELKTEDCYGGGGFGVDGLASRVCESP